MKLQCQLIRAVLGRHDLCSFEDGGHSRGYQKIHSLG